MRDNGGDRWGFVLASRIQGESPYHQSGGRGLSRCGNPGGLARRLVDDSRPGLCAGFDAKTPLVVVLGEPSSLDVGFRSHGPLHGLGKKVRGRRVSAPLDALRQTGLNPIKGAGVFFGLGKRRRAAVVCDQGGSCNGAAHKSLRLSIHHRTAN